MKVVGGGHSWSDAACTDGVLVSLDALARVIGIQAETQAITVEAGLRLKDLNEHLHRAGLAMPVLGSIAEQSVAGAISTGTHGSGPAIGNLASFVRALRIVRSIASALSETHAADVVHRDLKPSNIMWRRDRNGDDRITLVDFGIAVCKPGNADASHRPSAAAASWAMPCNRGSPRCRRAASSAGTGTATRPASRQAQKVRTKSRPGRNARSTRSPGRPCAARRSASAQAC